MIDERLKIFADYIENGIEGIKRTGVRVLEYRKNYVKLVMPAEGNMNHIGIMYAGSLFALGEVAGGAIFGASFDFWKYIPIAKEITIKFIKPALSEVYVELTSSDELITATNTGLAKNGKASLVMDVELKDKNNDVVTILHGTWTIKALPEGMKHPFLE